MVNKKSWEEFRATGLLMFINSFLHIFGWSIVMDIENEKVTSVYPARVKFRGFSEESQTKAYNKLAYYLKENGNKLYDEITEEEEQESGSGEEYETVYEINGLEIELPTFELDLTDRLEWVKLSDEITIRLLITSVNVDPEKTGLTKPITFSHPISTNSQTDQGAKRIYYIKVRNDNEYLDSSYVGSDITKEDCKYGFAYVWNDNSTITMTDLTGAIKSITVSGAIMKRKETR